MAGGKLHGFAMIDKWQQVAVRTQICYTSRRQSDSRDGRINTRFVIFYAMRPVARHIKHHARKQHERLQRFNKHPAAWPVWLFLGLVVASLTGLLVYMKLHTATNDADSHIAIVSYDHGKQIVPTKAKTVSELLDKLHIKLGQGDRVEPTPSTKIVQDNFLVNIYRAVPVTIVDNGVSSRVLSAAATPRSIVAQTGMTLYGEDDVRSAYSTKLLKDSSLGKVVTVKRATPVNLNIYGTQTLVRTQATTVQGLVEEKGIKLVAGATLNPAAATPVSSNMQLFVLSKGVSIVSAEEVVPAPQQNIDDNNLTLGAKAVRQVGSPGKRLVTYQITTDPKTGKEVSRQAIQIVVIQEPVAQITVIGKHVAVPQDKIAIMQAVGINPTDYGYVDYIVAHEGGWGGVTKSNYGGSGAYGICQALPGSKMASAGADWATNPVTQLKWCNGYAVGRYGSWANAYSYWLSHNYW